jgi:drug/metabolite transporter (DMT)-like permease
MNWFCLVVINVLLVSLSTLLQRILMKEEGSDPFIYALVFQLVVTFVVSIYAFGRGFHLPNLTPLLPFIGLMVVFYGFANVTLFKALQLGEASEVSVISSSRSLWTVLVAVTLLGEPLTTKKLLGALLVFLGIVFVFWKSKRFKFRKEHLFALLAAVLFGIAFANDTFLLRSFDAPSYTAFAFFLPSIFLMIIRPNAVRGMKAFFNLKKLGNMLLLAIFYGGAAVAIYSSYRAGGEASQIAPISQSSVIVTVLLAAIFLKERADFPRKIAAAMIVFLGVVLLR